MVTRRKQHPQPMLLVGHGGYVEHIVFAPDGRRLLSTSTDGSLVVWDVPTGAVRVRCQEPYLDWCAPAFFPAPGRFAATTHYLGLIQPGNSPRLVVWSAETGECLRRVPIPYGPRALSPDGRHVAVGIDDGPLVLLDAGTGEAVRELAPAGASWTSVDSSPDGRAIAAADADGRILLVDLESAGGPLVLQEARSLGSQAAGPRIEFAAGGTLLVAHCDHGDQAFVWGMPARAFRGALGIPEEQMHREGVGHIGMEEVVVSPDGRWAAAVCFMGVRVWSLRAGAYVGFLHRPARSVAFSPDSTLLATGLEDGRVLVLTTATWNPAGEWSAHRGWVRGAAFSPDGTLLATAGQDHAVRLWDAHSGHLAHGLRGLDTIGAAAFTPDGETLVTAHADRTLRLWDLRAGVLARTLTGLQAPASVLSFAADGERAATFADCLEPGGTGEVLVWDLEAGQVTRRLEGAADQWAAVAISPDGRLVAAPAGGHEVAVRSTETGGLVRRLRGTGPLLFSQDGRWLVAAHGEDEGMLQFPARDEREPPSVAMRDRGDGWGPPFVRCGGVMVIEPGTRRAGCILVYDTTTWQLRHQVPPPVEPIPVEERWRCGGARVGWLEFSRDGRFLAVDDGWGGALWNTGDWSLAAELGYWGVPPTVFSLSRDGGLLAISNMEADAVRVGAAVSDRARLLPGGTHAWIDPVVTFHPRRDRLAAATGNSTLRIWNPHTGRLLLTLALLPPAGDGLESDAWIAWAPDGRFDGSPGIERCVCWQTVEGMLPGEALTDRLLRPGLLAQVLGGGRRSAKRG